MNSLDGEIKHRALLKPRDANIGAAFPHLGLEEPTRDVSQFGLFNGEEDR